MRKCRSMRKQASGEVAYSPYPKCDSDFARRRRLTNP